MASSAAGGAPTHFSRLLRQSRIASFDPAIPQVYTAPPASAARGDWGVKRPLPSSSAGPADYPGALRYVEVQNIDTAEGQTSWKERERETLFVKRWAEADARLHISKPDSHHPHIPTGAMGPRPQTSFLPSSERYFPSDIPGNIAKAENETEQEAQVRQYNNKWRSMMKYHASRGAADPTYKGLDFMGEQTNSRAFGYDAQKFTTRPTMMKNYNALSEKEFEKFIRDIRRSRHKWIKYFQDKEKVSLMNVIRKKQEKEYATAVKARQEAEATGAEPVPLPEINPEKEVRKVKLNKDMLEASRDLDASRDAYRLLEAETIASTWKETSTRLPGASQPETIHPHAGLQYSNPDLIYAKMLAEPLPGRVIHQTAYDPNPRTQRSPSKALDGRSVAIGGHIAYTPNKMSGIRTPPPIDWSRKDPKRGTGLFIVTDAYRTTQITATSGLHRDMLAPTPDLGYVRSRAELISDDVDAKRVTLPDPIGSPNYIGKRADDNKPVLHGLDGNRRRGPRPLQSLLGNNAARKFKRTQRRTNVAQETNDMLSKLNTLMVDDE